MGLSRREFLATGALAAAGLPLIGACSKKNEVTPNAGTQQSMEIVKPTVCTDYFCTKFGITQEIVDKVLARTMSRGGSFGDLFFEHSCQGSVRLVDGKVSTSLATIELGMGARCVSGDQIGYAFTESFELEDMMRAADVASAIAPGNQPLNIQPRHKLELAKIYYDQSTNWDDLDVAKATALIKKVEAKAKAKDPAIIQVNATLMWHQRICMINTSDGINAEDSQPYFAITLNIVMNRNGNVQSDGAAFSEKNSFESISEETLNDIVERAYASTEILFHAIQPKGGELPVVLGTGNAAILLHEAIGHGLEADCNRDNRSVYSTKMNQRVAIDEVTIRDSGLFENSRGAINVDDEGIPAQDTVLIENGILKSYLHDRISANYYKVSPTGNGRRDSYKYFPIPRMRVTYMNNGPHELNELFEGIQYGVYCKKFTAGAVEIGQGDYFFYVKSGFLIENGKLTTPIRDVNIIGNGPDTLSKVTMVANDLEFSKGGGNCGKDEQWVPVSIGMPSIRVSAITVGGV